MSYIPEYDTTLQMDGKVLRIINGEEYWVLPPEYCTPGRPLPTFIDETVDRVRNDFLDWLGKNDGVKIVGLDIATNIPTISLLSIAVIYVYRRIMELR